MTEQEYIEMNALGTIRASLKILTYLTPEILTDSIPLEEYQEVMSILAEWQNRLYAKVNITTQE